MNPQTPEQWLEDQFEFTFCEECNGDAEHHTVCGGPFGAYFARCNFPPSAETNWQIHPVIQEFRAALLARALEVR